MLGAPWLLCSALLRPPMWSLPITRSNRKLRLPASLPAKQDAMRAHEHKGATCLLMCHAHVPLAWSITPSGGGSSGEPRLTNWSMPVRSKSSMNSLQGWGGVGGGVGTAKGAQAWDLPAMPGARQACCRSWRNEPMLVQQVSDRIPWPWPPATGR